MAQLFSTDDVQGYLDSIVEAGTFEAGSLRYRLLQHLVEEELAGRGDTLKAYAIGVDVFDKPESFDPSIDSSVRVAIGRLRTALTLFESGDAVKPQLKVDIPVGTYRPNIGLRAEPEAPITTPVPAEPAHQHQTAPPPQVRPFVSRGRLLSGLIGVVVGMFALAAYIAWDAAKPKDNTVVLEIEDFRGDPALANEIAAALRRVLSNSKAIKIVSDHDTAVVTTETDLVLNGSITRDNDGMVQVAVELASTDANTIVWARADSFLDDALLQSRITQSLGSELRIRVFTATKTDLADRDPETLTPEQLFMRATWVPGVAENAVEWELERVRLIQIALDKDPNYGSAHSVMADKLAYLANVNGPSNTEELRTQALNHAQRALELSALNPDVMFNVAQAYWHSGQMTASQAAMERVVDLDESHDLARFLRVIIPYSCGTAPDKIMEWAKSFDAKLSKDNPIRWIALTSVGRLHANRGEYKAALYYENRAALIFESPYSFMRRAMLLHKLDRTAEAAAIIMAQQNNWPDIDPNHFAQVTMPRLCSESTDNAHLIRDYEDLARALAE